MRGGKEAGGREVSVLLSELCGDENGDRRVAGRDSMRGYCTKMS